jgi:hypothetical protein
MNPTHLSEVELYMMFSRLKLHLWEMSHHALYKDSAVVPEETNHAINWLSRFLDEYSAKTKTGIYEGKDYVPTKEIREDGWKMLLTVLKEGEDSIFRVSSRRHYTYWGGEDWKKQFPPDYFKH